MLRRVYKLLHHAPPAAYFLRHYCSCSSSLREATSAVLRGDVPRQLVFVTKLSTLRYFTFSKCHADSFIRHSVTEASLLWISPHQPWCNPPQKPRGQCGALCKGTHSSCLPRAQQRAKSKGLLVLGIKSC